MKYFHDAYENAETPEQRVRKAVRESLHDAQQMAFALMSIEEEVKNKKERERHCSLGEFVEGKGVYIGNFSFGEDDGPFGKVWRIFAAPEDLKDASGKSTWSFDEAAKELSSRRNWHGHAGAKFKKFKTLITVLQNDQYCGEWFIPELASLAGMQSLKDVGDLRGTFSTAKGRNDDEAPDCYWSCNEGGQGLGNIAKGINDGNMWWFPRTARLSCRPIRAEPA
jgi:hypothetical protein